MEYNIKRESTTTFVQLSCSCCHAEVMQYQKTGSGNLTRCFLNRIFYLVGFKARQNVQDLSSKELVKNLHCPSCKQLLGTPMLGENGQSGFILKNNLIHKELIYNDL